MQNIFNIHGISNNIARQVRSEINYEINREIRSQTRNAIAQVKNGIKDNINGANQIWKVTFHNIPNTLDDLLKLPEISMNEPYKTAALVVAVLCNIPNNIDNAFAMLEYLSGPRGLSNMDKQFILDRFKDGNNFIPRSYFDGSSPANEYSPTYPYTITIYNDANGNLGNNTRRLNLKSSGADSFRDIQLRLKPSTGQWFLWEQHILGSIRKPASQDEWA